MLNTTTINGRSVTDTAQLHKLWSDYLDTCERFETGRPIAGDYTRNQMGECIERLGADLGAKPARGDWEPTLEHAMRITPMARIAIREALTQERALRAMASDRPLVEDFHGLKTWDGWSHERLSGDSDELEASAVAAEAEAVRLTFELHRIRKTTVNRVELSKLGLVARFSWKAAWAETVAKMRELGAEARTERSYAAQVRRELRIRETEAREASKAVNRWNTSDMDGATECETDYDWPTLDAECRRRAVEEGRAGYDSNGRGRAFPKVRKCSRCGGFHSNPKGFCSKCAAHLHAIQVEWAECGA